MKKLPNPPLKEVIFEVRWKLEWSRDNQFKFDKGFPFAQGKFHSLIKDEFPLYKSKVPLDVPTPLFDHKIVHQFWKGKNTWPVLQLGPGILSVNEANKHYEWENAFAPLICKSISYLFEAYNKEISVSDCYLKYIDAIDMEEYDKNSDVLNFISKYLNTDISNQYEHHGKLDKISLKQTFIRENDNNLTIEIANAGGRKQENILIWQTSVHKKSVFSYNEILEWSEEAHKITSDLFKSMSNGELYESFKRIHKK